MGLLSELESILDESLGKIAVVKRHIVLETYSRPAFQHPNQNGLKTKEHDGQKIDTLLKESVNDLAMSD